jgi:hypothetical protein
MGLYGLVSEEFLKENVGKKINVRIRDVPVSPGVLEKYGNGDLVIRTDEGKRVLIDMSSVIGIEET